MRKRIAQGFTIIELIVVIAVIGILATIATVGYGAWQRSIAESVVKSDLLNAVAAMENARTFDDAYPANVNDVFDASAGNMLSGGSSTSGYCVAASNEDYPNFSFFIDQDTPSGVINNGTCPILYALVVSDSNVGSVDLSWTYTADTFNIECSDDQAFNTVTASQSISASSVSIGGLDAAQQYYCRIQGVVGANTLPWSSLVSFTTDGWDKVYAGAFSTCGTSGGELYCWGDNFNGKLGINSTSATSTPTAVGPGTVLAGRNVSQVAIGGGHMCLIADGRAYCSGGNSVGMLGDGTINNSTVPTPVSTAGVLSGRTVTAIAVGSIHSCAVADGLAYCWGSNKHSSPAVLTYYGQLGNGPGVDSSSVPVAVVTSGVLSGKTVTDITAGNYHTCAVASSDVFCWGANGGALGNNSTTDSNTAVAVNKTGVLNGTVAVSVAANATGTCAIASQRAYCWGTGQLGSLGNGSTSASQVPVAVSTAGVMSGKNLLFVTAAQNEYGYCATTTSEAFCWGNGSSGQLGDNTGSSSSSVPVLVDYTGVLSGKAVSSFSRGTNHTCVVADGSIYCWGRNNVGQLGNGQILNARTNTPVKVLPPLN